eukprot:3049313-Amphidinium_carterae.1
MQDRMSSGVTAQQVHQHIAKLGLGEDLEVLLRVNPSKSVPIFRTHVGSSVQSIFGGSLPTAREKRLLFWNPALSLTESVHVVKDLFDMLPSRHGQEAHLSGS